jgi:hypothetical protein
LEYSHQCRGVEWNSANRKFQWLSSTHFAYLCWSLDITTALTHAQKVYLDYRQQTHTSSNFLLIEDRPQWRLKERVIHLVLVEKEINTLVTLYMKIMQILTGTIDKESVCLFNSMLLCVYLNKCLGIGRSKDSLFYQRWICKLGWGTTDVGNDKYQLPAVSNSQGWYQ